jgi:hypothetical protein
VLKNWLTFAPHVREDGLSKVPSEELVRHMAGIRWVARHWVEDPPIHIESVSTKDCDLIAILLLVSTNMCSINIVDIRTSGFTERRY